jgi:hypothetical protein
MQMSQQWMYCDWRSNEFINGMHSFIVVAEANKRDGFMSCPCGVRQDKKDCSSSNILHSHLLRSDFMSNYNCWTKHGERTVIIEDNEEEEDDENYYEGGTAMGEDEEDAPDELGRAIVDA